MKRFIYFVIFLYLWGFVHPAHAFRDKEIPATDIFKAYSDSIVLIGVVPKNHKMGRSGSGFFVSRDGLIITNYHLIENARDMFVKLRNNRAYSTVEVVMTDPVKDIAILKIEGKAFQSVDLGNSNHVEIGERVLSIGNPLGFENSISDGLVSSVREVSNNMKLLQISAPLSTGSSGGPLFNLKGEVVGIATSTHIKGQSVNFAVPINYAKPLLRKLQKHQQIEPPPSPAKLARKKTSPEIVPLALDREKDFQIYVVKPKDTLYRLANKFHTSVDALIQLNRLNGPNIKSGQKLLIP